MGTSELVSVVGWRTAAEVDISTKPGGILGSESKEKRVKVGYVGGAVLGEV